ncbi:MAG: oxidoreductase [Roseobacter sp.]
MRRILNNTGGWKTLICFIAAAFVASSGAALEPARGDVVLRVSGAISKTNAEDIAALDIEMLEEMGAVTFETSTIWTEGVQRFTGVELSVLLDALDAAGTQLRASAVNDYAVDIPMIDAKAGGPIVAFLRNGEEMNLRNKGPLWIVYPYDRAPEYQSELIYSRSIWQLDRIEVLP